MVDVMNFRLCSSELWSLSFPMIALGSTVVYIHEAYILTKVQKLRTKYGFGQCAMYRETRMERITLF